VDKSDSTCVICKAKDPNFAWFMCDGGNVDGRVYLYCHRCTHKCEICSDFATNIYQLRIAVIIHGNEEGSPLVTFERDVGRCDEHPPNIGDKDIGVHHASGVTGRIEPGNSKIVQIELISRLATPEEFQVLTVMTE